MTDDRKPEDDIPAEESVGEPDSSEEPAEEPADEVPAATEPVARATTGAAASADKGGPEVPPYIDDPVSKWWIGIIIAVFALIFVVVVFVLRWIGAAGV